jgi:hypothetical protein
VTRRRRLDRLEAGLLPGAGLQAVPITPKEAPVRLLQVLELLADRLAAAGQAEPAAGSRSDASRLKAVIDAGQVDDAVRPACVGHLRMLGKVVHELGRGR